MTIQMKATEQYFPVVLFVMLYKVVLTGEKNLNVLSNGNVRVFKFYQVNLRTLEKSVQCPLTYSIFVFSHFDVLELVAAGAVATLAFNFRLNLLFFSLGLLRLLALQRRLITNRGNS